MYKDGDLMQSHKKIRIVMHESRKHLCSGRGYDADDEYCSREAVYRANRVQEM